MTQVIIGNVIALVASIIMVYTGYIKIKEKIILWQTVQIGLSVVSNIVLGGITGAIINALSCVRNILCYKDKLGKKEKAVLIALSIGLSIAFNNIGWIGILPVVSTVLYILFMDIKNVRLFKYLTITTMILWMSYDFYIKCYVAGTFDCLCLIANVIALIQLRMKGVKKNENIPEG
ncbi:MAG: YgjV family protein [Clostridia bacterium]|nr:YgjV family protein [Clostridia bacterium]